MRHAQGGRLLHHHHYSHFLEAAFQSVHSIEYVIITDRDKILAWFDLLATWQRKLERLHLRLLHNDGFCMYVCACGVWIWSGYLKNTWSWGRGGGESANHLPFDIDAFIWMCFFPYLTIHNAYYIHVFGGWTMVSMLGPVFFFIFLLKGWINHGRKYCVFRDLFALALLLAYWLALLLRRSSSPISMRVHTHTHPMVNRFSEVARTWNWIMRMWNVLNFVRWRCETWIDCEHMKMWNEL